ncbi:unnamed protein product, partial [Amoebophrya sp. A25]|eukprot:GSA25T00009585001.1
MNRSEIHLCTSEARAKTQAELFRVCLWPLPSFMKNLRTHVLLYLGREQDWILSQRRLFVTT